MSRLSSAVGQDLRLQRRYGFLHAAAFVTVVWVVLLRPLPAPALEVAVPLVVFIDLASFGFFFVAGMVLFEKDEGTLLALLTTPLRFGEYLVSKLATLTLLAVVVSTVVALAGAGPTFSPAPFLAGVVLTSLLTLLVGFIAVSPFSSISDFLVPGQLPAVVLYLPLVDSLGWLPSPWWYLVPTQGSLLLLRGAFGAVEPWQVAYALAYQSAWVVALVWVARRAFDRYVAARRGGR